MVATANLSGQEIPERMPKKTKVIRRPQFARQSKNKFIEHIRKTNNLLWERSGNWDWYNEPGVIGKNWRKFYPILAAARKKNYVNTLKGQGGKYPGFFHYQKGKK